MFDVCVIGGSSIDIVEFLEETGKNEYYFGGKGANQAIASARAGGKVCIITKVGDDKYGEEIIKNLKDNNVTTYAETVPNCKSDYAKIVIDKYGNNSITRNMNAINSFTIQDIDKHFEIIKNSKYVLIQLKMPFEVTKYIINVCNNLNKKTILTACPPSKISTKNAENREVLSKISYICANEYESQIVFGTESAYDSVKIAKNKLIATLGEKGLIYFNAGNIEHVPAIEVLNVVDTTGAGDTFCGNLATNLAHNLPLEDALVRSQYASAYKIQFKSAQKGMPTKVELDNYINSLNT